MINPLHYTDFYKTDHRRQYPEGTEMVYSNLTARTSRLAGVNSVVVFGIQYFIMEYLVKRFNEGFFKKSKELIIYDYKRRLDNALGKDAVSMEHIAALHDLGYLPIRIKALPEGMRCPIRVPFMTIVNTHPQFFWVTNFLETLLCNVIWHPVTSATIAFTYRKILEGAAAATSDMPDFVKWQGHDFSMRGQTSFESSCVSGGAHLLSFTGTDTIPAIDWLEEYYEAAAEVDNIGGSVPATEHSVMCLGSCNTNEDEYETYKRLITEIYPKGIISIVSDTWDYWRVLDVTIRSLKAEILARNGKVVIRPDSGDPVKIICGDPNAEDPLARVGTIRLLWSIFDGTTNSKGYMQLNPHIGIIYGDSITLDRCEAICHGLKNMGFASTNIVFGIGSYTYQHVTRDTFGFAMKATAGIVNGKLVEIYKDPITDDGTKRSARGLLRVNANLSLSQQVTAKEEEGGMLEIVYQNGILTRRWTLAEVRANIEKELQKGGL